MKTVREQGPVPVRVDLRRVPGQVIADSGRRGAGSVGRSLSRSVWDIQNNGRAAIMAEIEEAIRRGLSPQEFANRLEPYLLPGRALPKDVPSGAVSNKPRSISYNAFRLSRSEIISAYSRARAMADQQLADVGAIVGTRWVRSRQHVLRLRRLGISRDSCDDNAEHIDDSLRWRENYGVDTKGLFPPGQVPEEHPNGLCITVPVPTPPELIEAAQQPEQLTLPGFTAPSAPPESWLEGDIKNITRLGGGITETFTGEIDGRKVMIKPESGLYSAKLRDGIPPMGDLPRERAAYLLAQYFGVDTPEVILRDVPGKGRSIVEEWREGEVGNKAAKAGRYASLADMRRAAIYDEIIGNLDRHRGNFLLTTDGKLILIDHGLAFPVAANLPRGNYYFMDQVKGGTLTSEEYLMVGSFLAQRSAITAELQQAGLGNAFIDAMFQRAQRLYDSRQLGISRLYL